MSTTVTQPDHAHGDRAHGDRAHGDHAHYDDDGPDYADYWVNRGYEHDAEVMAVRRLLANRRFEHAVDVGGGYGRLSLVLADYAARVTLADPSRKQLAFASSFLAGHPRIVTKVMSASALTLEDGAADLATLVRVLHHLPDPADELAELSRILRPGGYAVVEVANVAHAVNRLRYLARREAIPLTPVDIDTGAARVPDGIPFVNHHPAAILAQLEAAGLSLERKLSVSNLRNPLVTRLLPRRLLMAAEGVAQRPLAAAWFGPSIFLLARKPITSRPGLLLGQDRLELG